jgi:hypothetical protein
MGDSSSINNTGNGQFVRGISDEDLDSWRDETCSTAVNVPEVPDSSDSENMADEEVGIYAPGCSEDVAILGVFEAFVLRQALNGDPRAIAATQERAGGQGTVSGAQPNPAGIVSRDPRAESTRLSIFGNHEDFRELRIRADRLA